MHTQCTQPDAPSSVGPRELPLYGGLAPHGFGHPRRSAHQHRGVCLSPYGQISNAVPGIDEPVSCVSANGFEFADPLEIAGLIARDNRVKQVQMRCDRCGDPPVCSGGEDDPAALSPLEAQKMAQVLSVRQRLSSKPGTRRETRLEDSTPVLQPQG